MSYKSSLNTLISQQATLTDGMKESLMELVSSRCRASTKERLWRHINLPTSLWANWGIYIRVHLEEDGRFTYCAGQDYTSEIATVRKCLLEN